MGNYGALMIDPPWRFTVRSRDTGLGRSADKHYPTMTIHDVAEMDIKAWAADDCALFLWTTDPLLEIALSIMDRWGFAYRTVAFNWVKTTKTGRYFVGMGYWTRANPELCLLGVRGRPRRLSKAVQRLIVAPRREHSRKPDEAYQRVTELVAGPYLDVFSRESRDGWDSWGLETGLFDRA